MQRDQLEAASPHGSDRSVPESPLSGEHPGRIGPYRILSILGEGGMGVVYLAEQTEPVRRQVALKILKLGMDTRQVVARFEAERQSLAVMEHPGIARVFDAGATETGRPFFVMERVAGVPITEYCDRHRLTLRERVRLFLQVCRAVQHAHQKGVIHRDLKPSNVLVTEAEGGPLCKIIDFGIARATEQTAEERTRLTQLDQSLGTPAYMSPEQAIGSGLDIDTRTDIYSLGVLLYELMVGVLPFEPQAYQGWAFVAHHLTREPPRPSTRFIGLPTDEQARLAKLRGAAPEAVRRVLRGDLDWITLRALEKERERRYETANGFALDLERYLSNLPVLASPPGRAYAARKFVRRHRMGVTFAAVLAVLLVGFAAAMGVQAERTARARDIAEARQGQAEELIDFMLGDLRRKLEPLGRLDLLHDISAQALAYFAAVPVEELSDHELFRRSQALSQLGEVRFAQGDLEAATEAFRQSFALAQGLAARDPSNDEWQVRLGEAHFWLGFIPWRQGDFDGALEQFLPYLRLTERLVARQPDNLEYRLELSSANSNIGSVREAKGDLEGALEAFRSTLAVREELVRLDSTNPDWQLRLANTHNAVAVVQRKLGDLSGALENHRAELRLKQGLVARDSANRQWARHLASGHVFLGDLLLARGQLAEAVAELQAARDLRAALVARDSSNTELSGVLASSERLLAQALLERGEREAALRHLRSSGARLEQILAASPDSRDWQQELARSETALGRALLLSGQRAEAATRIRRALALAESTLERSPDHPQLRQYLGDAYLAWGEILSGAGDAAGARQAWTRAFEAIDPVARSSRHTDLLALSAATLLQLDRLEEAGPLLRELESRGYRRPSFLELARRKGLIP